MAPQENKRKRSGSGDELVPVVPGGEGNTIPPPKKRCNPAKKWVMTWFGSKDVDFLDLEKNTLIKFQDRCKEYCTIAQYQHEKCTKTGRHHLQGFVVFKEKKRPVSVFGDIDKTIHWEVMVAPLENSIRYTSKENTRIDDDMVFKMNVPRMVEKVTWEMLSDEVRDYIQPIMEEPFDFRTIHWVYDEFGNWGKSLVQKYLVDNHSAIMVAGAGKDIAYAIKNYKETKDRWPDYVLCNIPKSTKEEYISYGMLEQVKDGLVFSGKYESGQLRFPPVKLIVFANCKPAENQWSDDRVKLKEVAPPRYAGYGAVESGFNI